MREATSLLFKSFHEFVPLESLHTLPKRMRGIYALYCEDSPGDRNLVYVGMTDSGALGRLVKHAEQKRERWTHCSVFEVWDNITLEQIKELEAWLLQMLRKDASANALNAQKGSKRFAALRRQTLARSRSNAS
ncbi:MAG TPA: GIY-YIG nuclease family protein [Burkholderiaceae bacterium]